MNGMEDFFNQGRRVKKETKSVESSSVEPKFEDLIEERKKPSKIESKSNSYVSKSSNQLSGKNDREDRKRYPERTFDKYIQKGARLRSDDLDLLRVLCSEITRAKRDLPYEYRVNKRITDNTILRILVHSFCEKIEDQLDQIDFKGIQTEEDVRNFIEETMKF
jgi:hypothetical protein